MHRASLHTSRRQRRSIVLITVSFIMLSAVLHFALGGMVHAPWVHEPVEQRAQDVVIDTLVTPPPTPKPPRPTPRPTVEPVRNHHLERERQARVPGPLKHLVVKVPVTSSIATPSQVAVQTPAPQEQQAPQPESSPTPVDARDIIISARFIKRAEPEYPEIAIEEGIEGTAIILVTIGPDGSMSDARVWVSSGNAALDRAALQAAEQSTYAPPEVNGQPATQTYRIIYTFYLS
jgi:periplasmic protein TonB